MAPRKKGGRSSGANNSNRKQQFKVGDLVLAKLKGFPAWPATVSEPEKWGYPAPVDGKKVLVHFFGTQQIAFCNFVDVEEFTEAKKDSLLNKRHGKNTDFGRAIREIVESYETLKKQNQTVDIKSVNEINDTNALNLRGDLATKDHVEAPLKTNRKLKKKSYSVKSEDDLSVSGEDTSDAANNVLHDRDASFEERESRENLFSRRKRGSVQLQSSHSQSQIIVPCARRSRSSLKIGSFSSSSSIKAVVEEAAKLEENDNSIEENGSEIADSFSINEGSTVESGCRLLQPESIFDCYEGDHELNETLAFRKKTVVVKKKRKPSRKRVARDGFESSRPNEVEDSGTGVPKTGNSVGKSSERLNEREDGDAHLPLAKRARVRMETEVKLSDVPQSLSEHVITSLNPKKNDLTDSRRVVVMGPSNGLSRKNENSCSLVDKTNFVEIKTNRQFVHGEAALPPSKRIHRALEAMSANAVEDGNMEERPAQKTLINKSISPIKDFGDIPVENNTGDKVVVFSDILEDHACQYVDTNGISAGSSSTMPEEGVNFFSEANLPEASGIIVPASAVCNGSIKSPYDVEIELSNGIHVKAVSTTVLTNECVTPIGFHEPEAVIVAQSQKLVLSCSSSKDDCEIGKPELGSEEYENIVGELESVEHSGMGSGSGSRGVHVSPETEINIDQHVMIQVNGMCEVSEEVKPVMADSNHSANQISAKMVEVPPNMSCSTSVSDDHLGDKDSSSAPSTSFQTNGVDFPVSKSPSNTTTTCNVTTPDNNSNSGLEVNRRCSPDIHLHKTKNVDNGRNEGEVTSLLASFESTLGKLTRTKETITRATRIAIACLKHDCANKVVDIIVRKLESESSLYRRVDLFFLVDSIAQCSRGLTGDACGIYPSAIQSVLHRLLLAAAPPGSSSQENPKQCLKVLMVWLDRKILPESVVRPYIRDLETRVGSSSSGAYVRRPLRTERPFDDPIRQMEGMLVDEYGSNSSFQLPGFCMPAMRKDDDEDEDKKSDSESESFEAVTPEHTNETTEEQEIISSVAAGKHRHILEDVDGELEMEDVSPTCDIIMNSTTNNVSHTSQPMHPQFEVSFPPPPLPPPPMDVRPSSPPPPTSPPPRPPLPPPPPSLPLPLPPPPTLPPPPPPPPHTLPQPPPPHILPPPPPPPPLMPNGLGSKPYNVNGNLHYGHHSMTQHPFTPALNPIPSKGTILKQASESRDGQMQTQSHPPPIQPVNNNNATMSDNANFPSNNTNCQLRPPHPEPPSNHFSYGQPPDQRGWDVPTTSYPSGAPYVQNNDFGNFYTDHDRMKENWRYPGPSYPAPYYHDPARGSYPPPPPYPMPPPGESPASNTWRYPPPQANYHDHNHRPPFEGPVPVANRAPGYWHGR